MLIFIRLILNREKMLIVQIQNLDFPHIWTMFAYLKSEVTRLLLKTQCLNMTEYNHIIL